MSDTIPGGYYIGTDGIPHDAHGNVIAAPAAKPEPEAAPAPASEPEPEPQPEPEPEAAPAAKQPAAPARTSRKKAEA